MSVRDCSRCGRPFWSYAGITPVGYCSQACFDGRNKRVHKHQELQDEAAQDVIQDIRVHLGLVHASSNLTDWYEACADCDRLQERLAYALREAV